MKLIRDLFQSPKVAAMIRGGTKKIGTPKPTDPSSQKRDQIDLKQEDPSTKIQSPPSHIRGKEDVEIDQLAADISRDADAPASTNANVCISPISMIVR